MLIFSFNFTNLTFLFVLIYIYKNNKQQNLDDSAVCHSVIVTNGLFFFLQFSLMLLDELLLDVVRYELVA